MNLNFISTMPVSKYIFWNNVIYDIDGNLQGYRPTIHKTISQKLYIILIKAW